MLYGAKDFFGWVTAVKTYSPAVHVEVYKGDGVSMASRNGIGVNVYPFRPAQLIAVLRPKHFNMAKAVAWFDAKAKGQAYDWFGLLCFAFASWQGSKNKMFCSEFACRLDRVAGLDSFNPEYDADRVAPAQFFQSPAFDWVWIDRKKVTI